MSRSLGPRQCLLALASAYPGESTCIDTAAESYVIDLELPAMRVPRP